MRTTVRAGIYLALSVLVSVPFLVDAWIRPSGNSTLWWLLAAVNLAVWSSWPAWRWAFLQQATLTLTLLVVANLLLTPIVRPFMEDVPQTLPPNLSLEVHLPAEAYPGIGPVQLVSTDGRGYRSSRPIDYGRKPPGVVRILALGGSTTEEADLDDRKTWTSLLAGRLTKATGREVEVVNAGVSGLRAVHNLRTLTDSEAFAPDMAIFMLGVNDWNHDIIAANRPWFAKLVVPFSFFDSFLYRGLVRLRVLVERTFFQRPQSGGRTVQVEDGAYFLGQQDSLKRRRPVDWRADRVDPGYAAAVVRIMAECSRRRLPCVFIDQPTAYEPAIAPDLERRLWMTPPFQGYTLRLDAMRQTAHLYNAWLAQTAKASGVRFCAVAGHVPPTTEYFVDDCHFNERGAQRVAQLIADCLLRDGIGER
jgi:lysophospholipase L1-like esterase